MSRHPLELEIKFHLPADIRAALHRHPALGPHRETRHEVTTYFDTPTDDLARNGFSLRVRRIGQRHLQTLKLRARGNRAFGRNEWEWPVSGDTPERERLADTPAAPWLRQTLRPVFSTDIQRTVSIVRQGGTTIEIALDHGRIRTDRTTEEVDELELELKDGDAAPMYRFAAALHADVPMVLSGESKSDRGWRLRTGRPRQAVKHADIALPDDVTVAEAFSRIVDSVLSHLMANQPAAAAGDVEGVHQMRIAIRRLRAALVLFRPQVEPHAEARLTDALRSLGRIFGQARDWDVFCTEMLVGAGQHGVAASSLNQLRVPAEAARTASHARVASEMQRPALTATLLGLAEWGGGGAADAPLAGVAAELLAELEHKVLRRGRHIARASHPELHALRKALKKLRYSVEFLAPLLRHTRVKAHLRRSKRLLQRLGALNDAAVAVALAGQLVGERQPELAPAVGELAEWSAVVQAKARRHLRKDWHDFKATPLPR